MRFSWLLVGLTLVLLPARAPAGGPPKTKDKDAGTVYHVPYRLTDTGHIMVRIKIDGKGPFNFIVDTGAPLMYVSLPVAKKLGLPADKKGPATFAKVELEGGPVLSDFKAILETPFQLEGMNAMGVAGVELHGILGYTVLSHFKMEIDLSRDKMKWTRLDFAPPQPESIGVKGNEGIDAMSKLGKLLAMRAKLLGIEGAPIPEVRGFYGIRLDAKDKAAVVAALLAGEPAQVAGLQKGDVVLRVQRYPVDSAADLLKLLAKTTGGQNLRFSIQRGKEHQEIIVTAGEGL